MHVDDEFYSRHESCPLSLLPCVGNIQELQFITVLHTCVMSSVFVASKKNKHVGETQVVVKRYKKRLMNEKAIQRVRNEINIHGSIAHANIIPVYGSWSDSKYIYILIEYAVYGDLYKQMFLITMNQDDDKDTSYFMDPDVVSMLVVLPLLETLSYLHEKGIIHRDIKPENILLVDGWKMKLADFGLAVDMNKNRAISKMVGTCDYMAPEVISDDDTIYTEKVDIWTVGVIAYEMIFGYPPFVSNTDTGRLHKILNDHFNINFGFGVEDDLMSFLELTMSKDPTNRPSSKELLEHPWIVKRKNTDYVDIEKFFNGTNDCQSNSSEGSPNSPK